MTTTEDVQRITPDEAVAALTAAAWTEHIDSEKYEAAVGAVLLLCGDEELAAASLVSASDIRAAIRRELGTPRTLIHCFMGSLGADWDLATAIALTQREGAQCAWAPNMFRHELAIWADGKMHRFDARRPASPEGENQ